MELSCSHGKVLRVSLETRSCALCKFGKGPVWAGQVYSWVVAHFLHVGFIALCIISYGQKGNECHPLSPWRPALVAVGGSREASGAGAVWEGQQQPQREIHPGQRDVASHPICLGAESQEGGGLKKRGSPTNASREKESNQLLGSAFLEDWKDP